MGTYKCNAEEIKVSSPVAIQQKHEDVTVSFSEYLNIKKAGKKISPSKVSFKKLRGKAFEYENSKFLYGIAFGKNNRKVFIGIWLDGGKSASVENYSFKVKEGKYRYKVRGLRSGEYHNIEIIPKKKTVVVKIRNKSFPELSVKKTFKYVKNAYYAIYTDM